MPSSTAVPIITTSVATVRLGSAQLGFYRLQPISGFAAKPKPIDLARSGFEWLNKQLNVRSAIDAHWHQGRAREGMLGVQGTLEMVEQYILIIWSADT